VAALIPLSCDDAYLIRLKSIILRLRICLVLVGQRVVRVQLTVERYQVEGTKQLNSLLEGVVDSLRRVKEVL
jgi:hypothetical protein